MSLFIGGRLALRLQLKYPNQLSTIYKRPITLGILRETYSKWERRGKQNQIISIHLSFYSCFYLPISAILIYL
jgi:hypothetical protein